MGVGVLCLNGVLCVPGPEISSDRALWLPWEGARCPERFIPRLYINVPRGVPGLQKGDVLSVRRKLGGRNLRVAEDHIAVNQLRRSARFVRDRAAEGCEQENTHKDKPEVEEFHIKQFLSAGTCDTFNSRGR